jgi:hypothetical protein
MDRRYVKSQSPDCFISFIHQLNLCSSSHILGSATYWALSLQYFAQPIAIFLRNFPILLIILTFAVRVWELVGPFLYIFPIATQYTRLFGVFGFFALHIGFGVCLRLGTHHTYCQLA